MKRLHGRNESALAGVPSPCCEYFVEHLHARVPRPFSPPVDDQEDYIDERARDTFASLREDLVAELCEDPLERKKLR